MSTCASTDMKIAYPFNLSSAPLRRLPFLLVCFCSTAVALESMPPGLYEVTTETGMPHMEESMRSGITREKRCLHHQELSLAFPILSHAALKGCKLDMEDRHENTVSYLLICEGKQGTIGKAHGN